MKKVAIFHEIPVSEHLNLPNPMVIDKTHFIFTDYGIQIIYKERTHYIPWNYVYLVKDVIGDELTLS